MVQNYTKKVLKVTPHDYAQRRWELLLQSLKTQHFNDEHELKVTGNNDVKRNPINRITVLEINSDFTPSAKRNSN